jgi:hypothetical protein
MKLSWLFVILLLIFVAVFSVQNAHVITVRFLVWEIQISAALVIQLGGLLGGLVGLGFGAFSRRTPQPADKPASSIATPPSPASPTQRPALPAASSTSSSTGPVSSSPPKSVGETSSSTVIVPRAEKKPGAL